MEVNYKQKANYIQVKKRVEKLKGFYWHLISYVLVNIIITVAVILSLMREDKITFTEALKNFGVYATWFFWGIGLFFHALEVFSFRLFLGKKWEERKIKEFMNQ